MQQRRSSVRYADSRRAPPAHRPAGRRRRPHKRHRLLAGLLILLLIIVLVWQIFLPLFVCQQRSHLSSVSFSQTSSGQVSAKGLTSSYAVLVRRQDGQILMDKNSTQRIYPASMTKIMTVLVALQKMPFLNHRIEMTSDILAYAQKQDASLAGFQSGQRIKAIDLMYGALLPSGGECCIALARDVAGSETNFADLMNQQAKKIGMTSTHFANSTGLPNAKHYSTAKDIALLLDYALQDSTFRKIFTAHSHTTDSLGTSQSKSITLTSTLFGSKYSTALPNGKILGGKTGYTNKAGHCLASLANINGKEYILVTAHAVANGAHIKDAVKVYSCL
ncbi:MAG: serine hydrolase [Oscillospiraceae bacterium]|jgi:D-alanyl-D-alanine carboxypeptidase (penicillin-binding protein 5/6)|nr:serine hydrolase [Oscillospiraceae bacterium]